MLIKQKVIVFVGNQMKHFYANNYDVKGKKYIEVDVFDLNENNSSKVDILCDYCQKMCFNGNTDSTSGSGEKIPT